MGWTGTHAEYYKNGKVDVKRCIDDVWTQSEHDGYPELTVLKSSMVGSTYYAAVRSRKQGEPEEVFAAVTLTHVDNSDYFNITYKDMTENYGPCESKCPMSILKLLSPTDKEYAQAWRERCYAYHEKKRQKKTPGTLPVGTVIRFTTWNGKEYVVKKMAPNYQFKKCWWLIPATHKYLPSGRIPENFEIVEEA